VRPVEKVLGRLEGVSELNGSWKALCPAHNDTEPSLSVSEGDDGCALLKCFAGCANSEIISALGLEMKDLCERRNGHRKESALTSPETTATAQPCNLKNYARAKALPVEFLKKLGLTDRKYQGREEVRIPYRTEAGQEGAVRFRVGLEKSEEGDDRFRWRTGSKPTLYGLWRLKRISKAGWVVLVEGESDTQTLWYYGFPALGIPGVETWKEAWVEHLEGIEKIYVVIEPDEGGATLKDKLSTSGIHDRLHVLELGWYKDASELHVADPEHFKERFTDALKNALPWAELERREAEATTRKAWAECEDLTLAPNILDRFAEDLSRSGVVGESKLAKLLYLAVTSRILQKPVSVAMKGPSSDGKGPVTIVKLAGELKLDKSSAWRRVRAAMDRGYVKNLEERKGRPAQLVLGDPLPDDQEVLPAVERLNGCTVAGVHEGVKGDFLSEGPEDGDKKELRSCPSNGNATVQPPGSKRPLSFDLAPGESATLEQSRGRQDREEFVL
jgi:hypothetical protein